MEEEETVVFEVVKEQVVVEVVEEMRVEVVDKGHLCRTRVALVEQVGLTTRLSY